MKSCILSVIFLLFSECYLSSQSIISGVVTDSLDNPVSFASVYLSKTSVGTYSDIHGRYTLNIPQDGASEMVNSCIGYKLKLVSIYTDGKKLEIDVKLEANIFTLNEVTIKGSAPF